MASSLLAPGLPTDFLQTPYGLGPSDVSTQQLLEPMMLADADLAILTFQQSVSDAPSTISRAGLYVYINCLLDGPPLIEDIAFFNFLNVRYKGDMTSLVTDLVLACFDVLANAIYRNESTELLFLLRSYLVNKLPIFLLNYSDLLYAPFSVEYCIAQALSRVDPAAFPSFNQMFDLVGSSATLSEARQEFLFGCALHQLIPEHSIEILLGDVPMQSLPASGRYVKDELVAHCRVNPGRVEEMIEEIENMEGNAGEIAAALIEIINSLCATNDSMTLKTICNTLSRRKKALDVIMLFAQPISLLQPLCQVLDKWQEHEDQGEHQPVYDEFGSVLLIVAVITHRYDLNLQDLEFTVSESFTFRYIQNACNSRSPGDLSDHESQLLGNWIRGLFETEGIKDELMRTCSPKDFHLLIATLFDQSLRACEAGILSLETLKGGFEYLLEPFLLPSLAAGLTHFAHLLWRTTSKSPAIDTLLPTLHTLLKPLSISNDSAVMHSALLSIVAKPLESSLLHAQRQHSARTDIQPLLDTLKPHLQDHRHSTPSYIELERWCIAPGGGLSTSLRQTVQALTQWSSGTTPDTSPTNYTHQQLLSAIRIQGANRVLDALLDEVIAQTEAGNPTDTVLDIVVTMIAAPHPSTRLTLRDALSEAYLRAYELSQTNLPRAETIVRIHRRVEAQFGTPGRGDAAAEAHDVLLNLNTTIAEGGDVMAQNAQGMPSGGFDDVLVESSQRIESGGFMGGY